MRHRRGEGDDPAILGHDRRDDGNIGKMRAAQIRLVHDKGIARLHLRNRIDLDNFCDDRNERPQMDWNRASLRERFAVDSEEACRGVESFLHDWRKGRAKQRLLHFFRNTVELVANYLDRNGIKAVILPLHVQPRLKMTLLALSITPSQPGSTSVVVSDC